MTQETWESKKALPGFVGQEIRDKFDCNVFNNDEAFESNRILKISVLVRDGSPEVWFGTSSSCDQKH